MASTKCINFFYSYSNISDLVLFSQCDQMLEQKLAKFSAVVVAQLTETSLQIPEIRGFTTDIPIYC